jgi:nicotinamide-nucleotide amidase
MRVAGMPESDLDQLIAPVYRKYENPVTTILAAAGDIQIHLRARCRTIEEASTLVEEVRRPIEDLLGDRIYSWDGEPIEVIIGRKLRERRETVTVAESCTGGLLSEKITSVPGSSAYFVGGFVTYSNRSKIDWIGVPESVINEYGVVSKETAEALAVAARRHTGATYALSITGVAGPDADDAPKGTIYAAIADPRGAAAVHRQFIGDRARVRSFGTQMALDLLRRRIPA